jgi:predicted Zn finger-like uncharacterized protein
MRIMCPNCDAEYEVDAAAIPETGRDVQCSNCGHAWFQDHPEHESEAEAIAALYDPPQPLGNTPSQVDEPQTEGLQPDDWQIDKDDPEAILDLMGLDEIPSSPDLPQDILPKHELDAEAMRILREEAEHETAQRAAEQMQPNPDIQAPETAPSAPIVARRVARLKGIQPPQRATLPDVEDVKSDLTSQERFAEIIPYPAEKSRLNKVFWGILSIAALAILAYAFSPDLAQVLPAMAEPLTNYVGFVDGLRDGLDALLPQIGGLIQGLISTVKTWF